MITLILLAGGKGSRFNHPIPKQFLMLNSIPIARYSFDLFLSLPEISEVIVVCHPEFQSFFNAPAKTIHFALPGAARQNSVANGFQKVSHACEYVLIHDAARPLIRESEVRKLLAEGLLVGAAALGTPVTNTIKQIDKDGMVFQTLNRETVYNIQTPQLLRYDLLKQGLREAEKENLIFTDDVALAEHLGHPVKIVEGVIENLKITTQFDLQLAANYLDNATVQTYA